MEENKKKTTIDEETVQKNNNTTLSKYVDKKDSNRTLENNREVEVSLSLSFVWESPTTCVYLLSLVSQVFLRMARDGHVYQWEI